MAEPAPRSIFVGACLSVAFVTAVLLFGGRISGLGVHPEISTLGVFGCLVVALANGANDIANSMGTSVGARALTMRQAIVVGAAAEFLGAMTLGSFVAKTISKGVIDPRTYAADGCHGDLVFALGMLCVLAGTGSTTLLATLYGLPISASHGVIGGLISVGLVSHGPGSLGVEPILQTLVAWVASPVLGCLVAGIIHLLVMRTVHDAADPAYRAAALQPLLIVATVAVAVAFILITGPAVVRVEPAGLATAVSVATGVGVSLATHLLGKLRAVCFRPSGKWSGPCWTAACPGVGDEEADSVQLRQLRSPAKQQADSAGGVYSGDESTDGIGPRSAAGTATRDDAAAGSGAGGPSPVPMGGAGAEHLAAAERPFVPLLILSALTVAFAHGANDLGNSIGPLASILSSVRGEDITAPPTIPLWVLALGACGFVLGIATLGSRTIKTVGGKITRLTPSRSFAVQMGTAVAVLSSTVLGLAVSTSHCLVGAVIGIGASERMLKGDASQAQLNLGMLKKILIGWAATIPLAMVVSVLCFVAVSQLYPQSAC